MTQAERNKNWYERNKDQIKERRKTKIKTEREREQRRAATKRYRKNHPDRAREQRRQYERKNKDYVNLRHKKYYWADPIKAAFGVIRRKYKITREEFDIKLAAQDGKCAICQIILDKPHFDHNHTTGKNRDLLCRFCNLVLGNAHDSIQVLKNAVEYLIKHGE
jgi:hypothetical protein